MGQEGDISIGGEEISEKDRKLLKALGQTFSNTSATSQEKDDFQLLGLPQLLDFGHHPRQTHQPASTVQRGIDPLRVYQPRSIKHYLPPHPRHQITSSPGTESDTDSFPTPLSIRQRRRRAQQAHSRALVDVTSNSVGRGEQPSSEIDPPITPTPVRYVPLVKSASQFSALDDDDQEEEEKETDERDRALWSNELEDTDMDIDLGAKDIRDDHEDCNQHEDIEMNMDRGVRESSAITVVLDSTPIKAINSSSSPTNDSLFELHEQEDSGKLPSPVQCR
jgi:hypothetical protein